MLKFQLATKADMREAAILQHKRRLEEERRGRIFNARNRIIGVDSSTLDRQINEKRQREQEENEKEKKYINESVNRAALIREKEDQLNQERRRIMNEINDFRRNFQKKEDRREFDLYDPRKIELPARIGDNDPRLGISSAQKFAGEDLMETERLKTQKEQQRAWLQQQIKQRQQAENDRLAAERHYQEAMEIRDLRAIQLEDAERQTQRQIQESIAKYNLEMAAAQECERLAKKRYEDEDNSAEIYNCLTSDMLMENKDCAKSNFGLSRKITANYRGLTDEEIEQYNKDRRDQMQQDNNRKKDAITLDMQWEQMSKNAGRVISLKTREIEKQKRLIDDQIREENQKLAFEQQARKQYFDNVVYKNNPTSDYFAQFNTTSR